MHHNRKVDTPVNIFYFSNKVHNEWLGLTVPTCRLSAFLARPRSVSLRQEVNSCWEAVSVPAQRDHNIKAHRTSDKVINQNNNQNYHVMCLTNFAGSLWQLLKVLQQLWLLLSQLRHGFLPLLLGLSSHVALEESLEKFAVFKQGLVNGQIGNRAKWENVSWCLSFFPKNTS